MKIQEATNSSPILFLWIPKTAGSSIWSRICREFSDAGEFRLDPHSYTPCQACTFGHVFVRDLLREGILCEQFSKSSFKFAFVRNPWDRLVSLYFHSLKLLKDGWIIEPLELLKPSLNSFEDFLHAICRSPVQGRPLENEWTKFQAYNQIDWLIDDSGKMVPDFVGRFERIDDDFRDLCESIGMPCTPLDVENKTSRGPYEGYYNNRGIDMVSDVFSRDIKAFGYRFKNDSF